MKRPVKILNRKFNIHLKIFVFEFFSILKIFIYLLWNDSLINSSKFYTKYDKCETFDVVYTWVNGSDIEFINSLKHFTTTGYDISRFDDKNELKYSLRSLEKFAPWLRHIFLVTNGQIPNWLDIESKHITIVTHNELIDEDQIDILPTFSSSVIEIFLNKIPNLSKRFLYLNDDIFFGEQIYPEDLYTLSEGVKIYMAWSVPDCAPDCLWAFIGDGSCDEICNVEHCQFDGGDCKTNYLTEKMYTRNINKIQRKVMKRKPFTEILKTTNLTDGNNLKSVIDEYNIKILKTKTKKVSNTKKIGKNDIYGKSLLNTNRMLNNFYGYKMRRVPAHVGFLLDRDIINDMLKKFHKAVKKTILNRFRNSKDLQFSFAYYHFIINEKQNLSVSKIFDEFDTDKSLTWSDREIRTFLARLYPRSLDWSIVNYFSELFVNCSNTIDGKTKENQGYTTLIYERYLDSNIPTVTKDLVTKCELLQQIIVENFGQRPKYKFHVHKNSEMFSNFKMLTSNLTDVIQVLDDIRRTPKKFNCINDNLEQLQIEQNFLVKHILEDFYLSLFPKRSQFELPENFRNKFSNIQSYKKWKRKKQILMVTTYFLISICIVLSLRYLCLNRLKYTRRLLLYSFRNV